MHGYQVDLQADSQNCDEQAEMIYCSTNQNMFVAGQKDPGAPQRAGEGRTRTYKTKEETGDRKVVFSTIVLVLLGISFIVPMLQYYGYTSKE